MSQASIIAPAGRAGIEGSSGPREVAIAVESRQDLPPDGIAEARGRVVRPDGDPRGVSP